MKRAVALLIIVLLFTAGFFTAWGSLPVSILQRGTVILLIAIAIGVLALYLFSNIINDFLGRLFRAFMSPIFEENHRVNLVLSNRYAATEKALEGFSHAMELYAQHLASHTSAIQGLSEASQSLKGSAAEQNRILSQLTKVYTQQRSKEEVSKIQGVVYDIERRTREALQARDELEIVVQKLGPREEIVVEKRQTREAPPLKERPQSPQGCAVKPKALLARPHYYSN
jgi:hypothetical protein